MEKQRDSPVKKTIISPASSQVGDDFHSFSLAEVNEAGIPGPFESGNLDKEKVISDGDQQQIQSENADPLKPVTGPEKREAIKITSGFDVISEEISVEETGSVHEDELSGVPSSDTDAGEIGDKDKGKTATAPKASRTGSRKDALKFIEMPKERTRAAKRRGETLKKSARDFQTLTAAKVYFKAEYTGQSNTVYQFVYGADFSLTTTEKLGASSRENTSCVVEPGCSGDSVEGQTLSRENLKEIVSEAVAEGLDRTMLEQRASSNLASDDLFNSPSTGARRPTPLRKRAASGRTCQVCLREEAFIAGARGIQIPVSWFVCSATDCSAKAHNECLGFPNVEQKDINAVAPWYCSVHIGCGRPPISNPVTASSVPVESLHNEPGDSSADEAGARGRARGTRAGRPRTGRGSRGPRGGKGEALN